MESYPPGAGGGRWALAVLFSVVLPGAGGSLAQDSPAAPLTPAGAVSLALRDQPMIAAAEQEVLAARADRDLAGSGWLPRLDLTEDWARSTNPVFVFASKLGQQVFGPPDFAPDSLNHPDPYTNAATRLVLRQNVWDAGVTSLAKEAAASGEQAALASRERARDAVAFGALVGFWDAVLAERMVEVTRRAEKAAAANADLARALVETGIAVPSDRMAADVRLAEVRAMRIRADYGHAVADAALRRALGASDDARFVLDPPPDPAPAEADTADARVAEALASRADLRVLDRRLEQAGAGERMARHARLPSIGLGAQYEWNDDTPFGTAGGNWTVGMSVRVPVFDGTETGARIARARAGRDRLAAMRRAMEDGIRLEVRAAWADRAAADERLTVAHAAVGQARESLRIVRERYSEGMAVMVELLAAEAALTQAEASEVEARRAAFLARAALDLATGRSLAGDAADSPEGVAR